MKMKTPLVAVTLLALAVAGCSKHSSTAPKNFDLGVIEVSGGKPNTQILADGRGCTITPTVMRDGNVNLEATLLETNASGVKRTSRSVQVPGAPFDQPYTIIFDKDILTVKLK
jgi:hypothetical protein